MYVGLDESVLDHFVRIGWIAEHVTGDSHRSSLVATNDIAIAVLCFQIAAVRPHRFDRRDGGIVHLAR